MIIDRPIEARGLGGLAAKHVINFKRHPLGDRTFVVAQFHLVQDLLARQHSAHRHALAVRHRQDAVCQRVLAGGDLPGVTVLRLAHCGVDRMNLKHRLDPDIPSCD
jgi:hypothetical protein